MWPKAARAADNITLANEISSGNVNYNYSRFRLYDLMELRHFDTAESGNIASSRQIQKRSVPVIKRNRFRGFKSYHKRSKN